MYDVAVVGLGVVGSAALRYLADRGVRAIGLEGFGPTHRYGSSGGDSRIFRRAYWEGESYAPLLDRADELWREVGERAGESVIVPTGGLFAGSRSAGVVRRSAQTALACGVEHEILTSAQVRDRFPAFHLPDDAEALYEPGAYLLAPDQARLAMLDLAVDRGIEIRFGSRVVAVSGDAGGLTLQMWDGGRIGCRSVVLATGPWLARELVPELAAVLEPVRVPVCWFDAPTARMPLFLYETDAGDILYGCPPITANGGIKVGFHNRQQIPDDPDNLDRTVPDSFVDEIRDQIAHLVPDLRDSPVRSRVCYYTMSPDGSFLVGPTPGDDRVVFASACSGHGFKFAPAIGEAAAQLAMGEPTKTDMSPYTPSRFAALRSGA